MNTEDLKVFIDLINSQSFSKCAEINFLTQPAVSQKIKRLKEELGADLFVRTKKGLTPTSSGKILYEKSKKILTDLNDLFSRLKAPAGQVSGDVKISTIYSIGLYELNNSIKNFIKNHPAVHLDIEFSQVSKIYEDLLQETVDIGFVAYPKKHREIKILPFKKDNLILVVHPKHSLSSRGSIDIREINGLDFVGFKEDVPTREAIDKIFKKYKIKVKIKMEFDNIELIKRAVEINAGISILPSETVKQETAHNFLKGIPFNNEKFMRPLGIAVKKYRILSPAAQKFIKELR